MELSRCAELIWDPGGMPAILKGQGDHMRWHFITSLLLVAPCAGALAAQDTTQAQKATQNPDSATLQSSSNRWNGTISDELVLRQMHRTNQEEIRLGQLAQRNASSPKIKQFAARLVKDHQAADQKVISVAKQIGVVLPAAQDKGRARGQWADTTDHQGMMRRDTAGQADSTYRQGYPQNDRDGMKDHERVGEQLRSLRGAAFDTAFANAMVQGHERTINLLEMAQGQVQHEELRSLISSTLPTVREHLQIAQSLGGTAATTSSSQ
jgi:putative membrane protein